MKQREQRNLHLFFLLQRDTRLIYPHILRNLLNPFTYIHTHTYTRTSPVRWGSTILYISAEGRNSFNECSGYDIKQFWTLGDEKYPFIVFAPLVHSDSEW